MPKNCNCQPSDDFHAIRSRIVDRLILFMTLALAPGVALSIARAWDVGWLPVFTIQLLITAGCCGLFLLRSRLRYMARAWIFLLLLWILALSSIAQFGPVSDAKALLVALGCISMLLLDERCGWLNVAGISASLVLLGVAAVLGWVHFPLDYQEYVNRPTSWAVSAYSITVYSAVVAYLAVSIVRGLRERGDALAEAERRLRDIGNSIPGGGIYQLRRDPQGGSRFTYLSATIASEFGVSTADALQDGIVMYRQVLAEDRPALSAAEQISYDHLSRFEHEFRVYDHAGAIRWLHCRSMPQRQADGSTAWNGVILDVTERKQAEAELHSAKEQAESAIRAKNTFISNMNNELHTPLNVILGFAQVLETDRNLTEQHRHQVESIRRGGDYLMVLLNDLIDLAKIEAGRFEITPEPFDLPNFFVDLSEIFMIRASQHNIALRYAPSPTLPQQVLGDSRRLRQVLINLLGNAVKFTPQGSITLRASFSGGQLQIEVEDTGIGIAPEQQQQIFEPFNQVNNDHYKNKGTGLGLTITHKLVEAMGGGLTVRSQSGQGSCFRVCLPLQELPDAPAAPAASPHHVNGYRRLQGEGALRVLITDDLDDNRAVLRLLLEPLGFAIAEAGSGAECLALAQSWQPDLILLDLRMPALDGLETARALRVLPGLQTLPIIAVSASSAAENRAASAQAGCNAHLAKPVDLKTLLGVLQTYLPLAWQYRQAVAPPPSAPSRPLSPQQREELQEMLDSGAIDQILDYLEALCLQPDCPAEAGELLSLALKFEMQLLQERLRKIE